MAASLAVLVGIGLGLFDTDFEFFGAGFGLAVVAAAVTALVDRIGRVLNRRSLPFFFQQVVGAGVVTTVSVGLYGLLPEGLSPALVLAAGLTVLLSGLSVVSTAQDALTGFYVTAAGRAFEVALLTTGLVVGVVLALQVGDKLQVDITPPAFVQPELGDLMYQVPAAALTAAFFALASYAPLRALLGAGLGGLTSFTVYGMAIVANLGPTASAGLGAIVVGFVGRVVDNNPADPALRGRRRSRTGRRCGAR